MARFDNAYSRAIAIVKLVLPLVALGLLSTLFLLSRGGQQGEPLPWTEAEMGELAREERLGSPTYATLTEDGAELRLQADKVTPDPDREGVAHGRQLRARLARPDGTILDLEAPEGRLDQGDRSAVLEGGVRITASEGYVATMPGVRLRTNLTHMQSLGPVEADGPAGRIEAGGLTVTAEKGGGRGTVALFTDGVHLIYRPQATEAEAE
ncbi:hypothetical protein [Mangrovicoccus algicola]|uniref:LPS export ABC transporter periplasmic protein LptC n=1 Tax=Mangrovicoccus algicola TaxID=2771008 RepID=A0A8J6YWL0_9RHOB|nr:hypothetical protein [Mangrovicoccus algicola]MBE3638947.1 hypothetical protein [Mangrovicoccus algicola]